MRPSSLDYKNVIFFFWPRLHRKVLSRYTGKVARRRFSQSYEN
jgi:hypothetical protein